MRGWVEEGISPTTWPPSCRDTAHNFILEVDSENKLCHIRNCLRSISSSFSQCPHHTPRPIIHPGVASLPNSKPLPPSCLCQPPPSQRLQLGVSLFFFFYCDIVALHCYVSFFCTAKWISCMDTYIPSFLYLPPTPASHPSRWSQSTELSSLCYAAASH